MLGAVIGPDRDKNGQGAAIIHDGGDPGMLRLAAGALVGEEIGS
jgi:hypothetical protein